MENGGRIYDFYLGRQSRLLFIGGVLLYEFAGGLIKKDRLRVRNSILTGIGVGGALWCIIFTGCGALPSAAVCRAIGKTRQLSAVPREH